MLNVRLNVGFISHPGYMYNQFTLRCLNVVMQFWKHPVLLAFNLMWWIEAKKNNMWWLQYKFFCLNKIPELVSECEKLNAGF